MAEHSDNPQNEPARDAAEGGGDDDVRPDFLEATIVDDGGAAGDTRRPTWQRLPWGGVLALLLVLLGEQLVLAPAAPFGPWEALLARVGEGDDPLERGLVLDRLALERAAAPKLRPRVTLVGTSRTDAAFQPELVPEDLRPPLDTFELAHARVFPHELLSMLPEVLSTRPDLVVTVLSEHEFFLPLKIVPKARGPSWSALFDLGQRLGWGFFLGDRGRRETWLRSAALCLSPSYRYRSLLDRTVFGPWRRFPMGSDGSVSGAPVQWPDLVADGEPLALAPGRLAALRAELDAFYPGKERNVAVQFGQVRSLRDGRHARLKMDLMQEVFARLRASGAEVLVVEGLIQPLAEPLYDRAAARAAFGAWMERVGADPGIHFLPVEEIGRFDPTDFRDLTHVNKQGALKYTIAILDQAARRLTPEWHAALERRLSEDG